MGRQEYRRFGDTVVRPIIRDFLKERGFLCKKSTCSRSAPPIEVSVEIMRSRYGDWYQTGLDIKAGNDVCPYPLNEWQTHVSGSLESLAGDDWKAMRTAMDGDYRAMTDDEKAQQLKRHLARIGPKLDRLMTLEGFLEFLDAELRGPMSPQLIISKFTEDLLAFHGKEGRNHA